MFRIAATCALIGALVIYAPWAILGLILIALLR